jgi:formamidopyrimidine-DNA glycosylase
VPEAAEVQTVASQLAGWLPATVDAVDVWRPELWRHGAPRDVVGATLVATARYGKWLTAATDAEVDVRVHLRMTGRLWLHPTDGEPDAAHTHLRLHLTTPLGRCALDYVDPRRFGGVGTHPAEDYPGRGGVPDVPDVADLAAPGAGSELAARAGGSRSPVKALLLDQRRLVAGVGNYLADEACWRAGLPPTTPARALDAERWGQLAAGVVGAYRDFADARGTSLSDETWRDLYGEVGDGAGLLVVHARTHCRACGHPVERSRVVGRSAYWCPACQPAA